MSEQESIFLKKLRNTIWQAIASLVFLVIIAAVPFYFNTTNKVENQQKEIEALKQDKADKQLYELTVQQINQQLLEIKQDIKDIKN